MNMLKKSASDIAEEGFYWRICGGEWDIVRLDLNDDPKSRSGSKFLIHTSGWDIPETVGENADAHFVGPLNPPDGQ